MSFQPIFSNGNGMERIWKLFITSMLRWNPREAEKLKSQMSLEWKSFLWCKLFRKGKALDKKDKASSVCADWNVNTNKIFTCAVSHQFARITSQNISIELWISLHFYNGKLLWFLVCFDFICMQVVMAYCAVVDKRQMETKANSKADMQLILKSFFFLFAIKSI